MSKLDDVFEVILKVGFCLGVLAFVPLLGAVAIHLVMAGIA